MNKILAIFAYKCPRCRQGNLFNQPLELKNPLDMPKNCPICGQRFEPEPGFYFGAMFVSYALGVFTLLPLSGICLIYWDMTVVGMMSLIIFLSIISFLKVMRLSRSIWIHINVKYDPKSVDSKKIGNELDN